MGQTFGQAFGELIRTKRGQEGLTQKALAILAFNDESKVRRINDIEAGAVNRPQIKTVDALVVALGIRDEELANCKGNTLFTAQEEAGIGLSRQLMENLALRFSHENPNAPDAELFNYLKDKAEELKALKERLKHLEGLASSIHDQVTAANLAIEAGEFNKADELLAAAEDAQQSERTLKEVEAQSAIRFARGDTALFAGQQAAAADHYSKAAEYFYGFDKKQMASMLELSAAQIYEYERRTLAPNFEHAIRLAERAMEFIGLADDKTTWVLAKYRLAMLQQVQASAVDDNSLYDNAILTAKEALENADTDVQNEHYSNAKILLGNCYINRSEGRKDSATNDLMSAIDVFESASKDARVDRAQYHSYIQSSLSAAYSKLSHVKGERRQEEYVEKANKALRRAIELSAQEGQIDLWAACQYNLGNDLAGFSQRAEAVDPIAARFLRIQAITAFNASLEAYPETLMHPHTRRTQMSLGRVLLEQARFTTDARREIYLTRSIHAHETVLAMSDRRDDAYIPDAQFSIGLAFYLHADITNDETAISDLEEALEYFELARPGYGIDGRDDDLRKLESAKTETKIQLEKLRAKQA